MSATLDRFDEVIGGATNDEVIELSYRLLEELAERAGNVSRLALDEDDRDLVNEAHVYVSTVKGLFPFSAQLERIREASYFVLDCKNKIAEAVEARGAEAPSRHHGWSIGRTPATRRMEAKRRAEEQQKADELLASVDISPDSVLDALRTVAADGPVQVRDVALFLCPDAAPADTPGRQQLINRVSSVIVKLAKTNAVAKASEASYEKRRTCRWGIPAEEVSDAS